MRVLLIVDEPATAQSVELTLQNEGMVVDTTALPLDAHSQSAVMRLEEAGYDSVEAILERATEEDVDSTVGAVRRGDPAEAILDYTEEHDVDLVVMSTHGRTGIRRFLLGSVTEQVLRSAGVPVLTVGADGP